MAARPPRHARPPGGDRLSGARSLVWVTRAEPGASATAARLRDLGLAPLVAPLIETRPLPGPPPDLTGVGAVAFTSRAGVEAFAARAGGPAPDLPVFTVGDATARAARLAGFTDVRSASGAGRDLLALVLRDAPSGVVLYAGAREPAFDLVAALTAEGRDARAMALYETVPAATLPPNAMEALSRGEIGALLIHSHAAARALARLAEAEPALRERLGTLTLGALSPDCAAPLAAFPFAARITAAMPDESSLLEALLGAGPARG